MMDIQVGKRETRKRTPHRVYDTDSYLSHDDMETQTMMSTGTRRRTARQQRMGRTDGVPLCLHKPLSDE